LINYDDDDDDDNNYYLANSMCCNILYDMYLCIILLYGWLRLVNLFWLSLNDALIQLIELKNAIKLFTFPHWYWRRIFIAHVFWAIL